MNSVDLDALTDLIYESAAIPERWPRVLEQISLIAECDGAALFTIDTAQNVKMAATGIHVVGLPQMIKDGWMERNTRVHRASARNHPGFLTDQDLFTPEEMEREPLFEYLRANGAGWGAGTIIPSPSGDIITLAIDRAHKHGPVRQDAISRLDHLRPHLARAGLLSCRLRLEQARSMVTTLELIGLPGAVLRSDGRMLASNALLNSSDKRFVFRAFDYLSFALPATEALFKDALADLKGNAEACTRSIPLPPTNGESPAILHVIPTRGSAADIFGFASSLLVVTPLATPNAPSEHVLNGLFDLTAAESRVTRALVSGQTIEEIAQEFGVAVATVRTQLRSILHKTGMRRQAELVGLLAGTWPLP